MLVDSSSCRPNLACGRRRLPVRPSPLRSPCSCLCPHAGASACGLPFLYGRWALRVRTWARGLHLARSALFAVCFRWGLRAFLFRSSHVEILSSHDARSTAVAHLPPARLGGVSSLDPLGPAASRLAPLPLRQPPLLPAPPLLVSCLAAPLAPGHQSSCESLALHTLTTQQLRRESVKVKILLCRPSRHSSCVVRV